MTGIRGVHAGWPVTIPVDPDAPEAQQWLRDELAKAPYQAARPTWFDRMSEAFLDWIDSLTAPAGDGFGGWVPLVVILLLAGAIVAAWLLFGVPRLNRRSQLPEQLFGKDDRRSAEEMRRAAEAAAAAGDWSLASEEVFRALARGLAERTVLSVTPGTTAHDFTARAAVAFPTARGGLAAAADVFDRVRYLGVAGTEPDYRALAVLEVGLRDATPVRLEPTVPRMPS